MGRLFCKYCGKPADDDSKYCKHCGLLLNYESKDSADDIRQEKKYINPSISEYSNRSRSTPYQQKYDESYEREYSAVIVGTAVIMLGLMMIIGGIFTNPELTNIIHGINFLWRVIVVIWVVSIADHQNRNTVGWGITAFLIPNLTLIIIGLQKKLLKDGYHENEHVKSNYSEVKEDSSLVWGCPNCYTTSVAHGKNFKCPSCNYSYHDSSVLKPRILTTRKT